MAKKELANVTETGISTVSADLMIQQASPEYLAKLIQQDGFAVERVVTLEEGQVISGIFDGEGGNIEVNALDKAQGDANGKQSLRTWRIKSHKGNMVALLLTCAQFESRFSKMPKGTLVEIVKLPKVKTNAGMMANDYHFFTKEVVAPAQQILGV